MTDLEREIAGVTDFSISHWQPYPEYKDSATDWIGDIPAHWNVKRLKTTITSCQNGIWGDEPNGDDKDVICIRVADFDRLAYRTKSGYEFTRRSIPSGQLKTRLLKRGDLLLEKSGGGELQPVGAVVLFDLDTPAVFSNFMARLVVAKGYSPRFLCYLHAVLYSARINTRSIKQNTGIQNLDSTSYLNEFVGIPLPHEQQIIAAFLDRETVHIDTLIAKKRELIALLQEQRSGLISQSVTKGLNPDAPMKDSGIEWLGEIPAHWDCYLFKRSVKSMCDGPFGSDMKSSHYSDTGVRLIRLQNIGRGFFDNSDQAFISEEHFSSLRGHDAITGDLLVAGLGDPNHPAGRACILPEIVPIAMVKADCFRVRLNESKLSAKFAMHYLCSSKAQIGIAMETKGATRDRINLTGLANLIIVAPPLSEQNAIINFLEKELMQMDSLISKTDETIVRLQEYRTSLISAAVTGKIDVRGEV